MSGIATAIVGGAIITGVMGNQAAKKAAKTQADAANAAAEAQLQATEEQIAAQKDMYQQNVARQLPWVMTGGAANARLSDLMGLSGNTTAAGYGSLGGAGPTLAQLQLDPGYNFRVKQGMMNLQASAAARGGLLTGQGLKDITDYSQGAASQEYQNAFNRYVTNQTNQYNRLSAISGTGQNAAAGVGAQGTQVGTNIANTMQTGMSNANNYLTGGAAASAAGTVGQANAWSNAVNSGLNNFTMMQFLNRTPTAQPQYNQSVGGYVGPLGYNPSPE